MAASTKNRPSESANPQPLKIIGIIVAVIVVLLLVAVVAGFIGNEEPGNEYGDPQVSGQLSRMPQDTRVDVTANGETSPTVIGQDFGGNEVRIENDGRAKAIVLIAHWCGFCQNEVPAVQAWLDAGGGVDGVDMYSIATDMDSSRDNFPPGSIGKAGPCRSSATIRTTPFTRRTAPAGSRSGCSSTATAPSPSASLEPQRSRNSS